MMAQKIKLRRDTSVNWQELNPVLADGELGLDITLGLFKTGNGVTAWNALGFNYAKGALVEGTQIVNAAYAVTQKTNALHGLGKKPDILQFYWECVASVSGWAIGDRVSMALTNNPAISCDASNISISTGSTNSTIIPKAGGASVAINNTYWRMNLRCWIIK